MYFEYRLFLHTLEKIREKIREEILGNTTDRTDLNTLIQIHNK